MHWGWKIFWTIVGALLLYVSFTVGTVVGYIDATLASGPVSAPRYLVECGTLGGKGVITFDVNGLIYVAEISCGDKI